MSDQKREKKKTPFTKTRTFPVLFMLIITFVFISITSGIFTITRDTISLNETLVLKRAVLSSAGIAVPKEGAQVENVYSQRVREKVKDGKVLYYEIMSLDSKKVESYVMIVEGPGLWGQITAAVGYGPDLKVLTGIEIIDQNETPGLGGRITESWFKKQFRGKKPPLVSVPEGSKTTSGEFQAITGASYTTAGIRAIINDKTTATRELIRKEQT
jgi:Na+-transporting NADH:ubiquinone oxidoreductase subunit C